MSLSRTDPARQTITSEMGPLSSGGKSTASNTLRKSADMTRGHQSEIVTPAGKTMSFGKYTVAVEGKTEAFGETIIVSMESQTKSPGEKIVPLGKRVVTPEMITNPSGNMTVIPDGQAKTLRGEATTSEVNTDHLVGYFGL